MGRQGEENLGREVKDLLGEVISQLRERRHKKEGYLPWFVVSYVTNESSPIGEDL